MCKKYGCELVQFTHDTNNVIHGSNKSSYGDAAIRHSDEIRYLSLPDKKYICYFPGHTDRVVALAMNPTSDMFLSGARDKTIRLWDLRSPGSQGVIRNIPGRTIAAFDPEGRIFAAGVNSESIRLFDTRQLQSGPFASFKLTQDRQCEWSNIKFSPNGKLILVSTNGTVLRLFDAFKMTPLQTFTGFQNSVKPGVGMHLKASFSPDSQYVFTGSTNGKIHCWNTETGAGLRPLECGSNVEGGPHNGSVQCVQFNPKYNLLASAHGSNICFWFPQMKKEENKKD